MTRRSVWLYLLIILASIVTIMIVFDVDAQEYGTAQYYRSDAWSTDKLVDYFRLDPGVQGDSTQGQGDFESWQGSHATCFDCPTGWTCNGCAGTADIQSDIVDIYSTNTSMEMFDGDDYAGSAYRRNYDANTCYQITWCHKGAIGGQEDYYIYLYRAGPNYYNFGTNAWQAGATTVAYNNISATWTCTRLFFANGAVATTDVDFNFVTNSANDTIFIDNFQIQELNTCTVIGKAGNPLSVPVTSDPLWGKSENILPRVGTGPAGRWSTQVDGVDDYLSCTDATCEFDPDDLPGGGHFSWGCRMITDTIAAGTYHIFGKWRTATADRSWGLYQTGAFYACILSKDGSLNVGSYTAITRIPTAEALSSSICSYQQVSDGTSDFYMLTDHQAEASDLNSVAPIYDGIASLTVGAYDNPSVYFNGTVQECAAWYKPLNAIERSKWSSPYYPGTVYGDGFYTTTCTQAASHATCSSQRCRNGTPNAGQAEGTGMMAAFTGYTERVQNNSYEANTGSDPNPTFTNWTTQLINGNGNATITAYRANTKHGEIAARVTTTGTTSIARLNSDCIAVNPATTYYGEFSSYLVSGTTDLAGYIVEYTDGACANYNTFGYFVPVSTRAEVSWQTHGGSITTNAGTNSIKFHIQSYQSIADVLIDNVSCKAAAYHTPWVHNPAGATSYNARDNRIHNPLVDYIQAEDGYAYESGWCIGGWVYTDWPGNDGANHYYIYVPGTVGNNNRWYIVKSSTDLFLFLVTDNAGNNRSYSLAATATNWTAGGDKYVEACTSNVGVVLYARHYNYSNDTWYNWTGGGGPGTGVVSAQATEIHVGHAANTLFFDGYTSEFRIGPYSVIWPMYGWNNGIPPGNDGRPY